MFNSYNNKEEIRHQIPHFLFFLSLVYLLQPYLVSYYYYVIIKIYLKKVIQEVYSLNDSYMDNYENIYKLTYLRKCILKTLRLNNVVSTTFRTLTQDYTFDNKYSFVKKGTQFLHLIILF